MLKVRFIYLESVKFILVSYFIHMILNVNGFCDVKKPRSLTKPFIEFILFKFNFFTFCTKNGPINIDV